MCHFNLTLGGDPRLPTQEKEVGDTQSYLQKSPSASEKVREANGKLLRSATVHQGDVEIEDSCREDIPKRKALYLWTQNIVIHRLYLAVI